MSAISDKVVLRLPRTPSTHWIVLALCGLTSFSGCTLSPGGSYYDKYVGSVDPAYWVFRNGNVYWRLKETPDELAGYYSKQGRVWILHAGPSNRRVILKPKLLGIRMISTPDSQSYMNRYLPRRGFAWLNSGRNFDPTSQK